MLQINNCTLVQKIKNKNNTTKLFSIVNSEE